MYLTKREEMLLDGEFGEARSEAMKLLVTIGDIFEASRMVKVRSVQVSGVSYKNIGDAGLEYVQSLADRGAFVEAKATLNPAGMDLERWREYGVPEDFAERQLAIISAFRKMGVQATCTCIPYYAGNRPKSGEHIAWAESSAVVFANSVLGARTNREGGPTALASAITGLTPLYGLHLDENRKPTHVISVETELRDELEHSLLGYVLGTKLGYSVPLIRIKGRRPSLDELKALGAGMAASGGIALYHLEGQRPKRGARHWRGELEKVEIDRKDLASATEALSTGQAFEHICIGCPHCSLRELRTVAALVEGRQLSRKFWCYTNRYVYAKAKARGYVEKIERAGGEVILDTCMVVSPIEALGVEGVITNSCKAAHYLPSLCRAKATLASLKECVEWAARP